MTVHVANQSMQPVYDVRVALFDVGGGHLGDLKLDGGGVLAPAKVDDSSVRVPVLLGARGSIRTELAFRDARGQEWIRTKDGLLEPAQPQDALGSAVPQE